MNVLTKSSVNKIAARLIVHFHGNSNPGTTRKSILSDYTLTELYQTIHGLQTQSPSNLQKLEKQKPMVITIIQSEIRNRQHIQILDDMPDVVNSLLEI